jgi:hypothetical protein
MKREFDRFIGGPSDREQDASVEVYLTVTDEGRPTVSTGWRYLALAIVIVATGAALLVTSLGASASPSRSRCDRAPGYGGLGGRVRDFDANNNNSTGEAGPSPGTAFYTVTATARGCVTAFAVQESASPPLSARDLLFLVSHPYLPVDARQLVSTRRCAVWRSAALRRATGRAYARATAAAQATGIPGRAQIEATTNPAC